MRGTAGAVGFVIASIGAPLMLSAQTAAANIPSFEVASVKVSKGADAGRHGGLEPGGRFTVNAITLRDLIRFAYPSGNQLRGDSQLAGGPAWIETEQFDIDARAAGLGAANSNSAAGAASQADLQAINQVRLMVRSLLAERFHVAVHEETRQLPSYALTLAKADTMGPHLHKTAVSCAAPSNDAPPPAPDQAGCGGFRMLGPGRLTGHVVSLQALAGFISQLVQEASGDHRPVVDATGISGNVDFDFNWTPDQTGQSGASSSGASMFTALQEQLGLKLVSARTPVNVLIVDRADHPTPD